MPWLRPMSSTTCRPTRTGSASRCTGFRDDLRHLSGSGLRGAGGQVSVQDGVSTIDPRFGFVGHGDWTGPFSNTIVGVGGYARVTTGLMGVEQMGAGRRDL